MTMSVYRTVVVGTDGSVTAGRATRKAAQIAARIGAPLLVVAAYHRTRPADLGPPSEHAGAGEDWLSGAYRAAAETAQDAAVQASRQLDVSVDTAACEGDPADVLIDVTENHPRSLLVVGSKGMTDSTRFLLGNVPNKVSHHAQGDVLIVRTDEHGVEGPPAKILVGTDGSKTAMRAVERAVELCAAVGAPLTILSAGRELDTERAITLAAAVADGADVDWTGMPRSGDAATELVEAGETHDLVVVGNRGMGSPARFLLGSVPNKVSHHVGSDLLIVKTDRPVAQATRRSPQEAGS
jgi:nucleotide-binding universal stress UspA family protein